MSYSKSFTLTKSTSREVLIQRSSHFLGHLQKKWVAQNLRRYLLSLTGWKSCLKESFFQLLPNESTDFLATKTTYTLGSTLSDGKAKTKANNWKSFQTPFCWQNNKSPSSILNCLNLHKIVLHSTSGKLYQSPKHCALLDLAFLTISCQTPTKVYSRKAVAAFKLSKLSLLGVKTTLRNLLKHEFFYKFYFLQASEHSPFIEKAQHKVKPLPLFPDILTPLKSISLKSSLKHKFNKVVLAKNSLHFTLNKHIYNQKLMLKKNNSELSFTTAVAIKNLFIFNELDSLDYSSFSNLTGFEIMLIGRKVF